MRGISRGAVGLVAGVLVLGACSTPLPTPEPDPVPAAAPAAVSPEQVERILADLDETLAAADAEGASTDLPARMTGPAVLMRRAEYILSDDDTDVTTPVPSGAQTVMVPTTTTWPRSVFVITEPPEDLQAPLLLTLVQEDPRAQFRLWSWVRLFPGVEMPATAQPEVGSAPVDPAGDTLLMTPSETLGAYIDLVDLGDKSEFVETFAEDPLRDGIRQTRAAYRRLVDDKGGIAETYQVAQGGPYAIGTAEGGAIVVGSFRTTTTITLDDSTLTVGDDTAELLGKETVSKNLAISWLSVVAFAVPPAGSTEQVQVLGAEHSLVDVTGR